MARRYGRSPRGERLVASVPHGHWKTSTFIAGLRNDKIVAPYIIDGAVNGELFRAYVEQVLAPTLTAQDIVIMDNLRCHKVAGVREAIQAKGASVLSPCVRVVAAQIGWELWGRGKTQLARYGRTYKRRVVARLLPPESSAVDVVSREVGVSVATLERWRAEALAESGR